MEALAELKPLVVPKLTGCPDSMVLAEIRAAWRRFCADTEAWRANMEVDLAPKRALFLLPLPAGGDVAIVRLVDVWVEQNGHENRPHPAEYRLAGDWGAPALIFRNDLPEEGTLVVRASIAPLPALEDPPCDPELLHRFAENIAAGAVWKLAGMGGRPWSAPEQAAEARNEYMQGVARAKSEIVRGRRRGLQTLFGASTLAMEQGASPGWDRVFGG